MCHKTTKHHSPTLSNTGLLGNYSSSASRVVPQDNQASLSNTGPLGNHSMTSSAPRDVPQDNQASLSNTGPLGNHSMTSSAPRDVPQDNQASLSNTGPLGNHSMTSSAPRDVPQDNQASLSNTGPLGNYSSSASRVVPQDTGPLGNYSMTSSAPRVVPQASLSNTGPLGNYSLSAYRVVPQDNQASFSNTGLGIYQPSNANTVPLSQSYFSGGPPCLTTPLAFQVRRPLGLQSPPLLSPPSDAPYVLVFVKGNITTCFGCRAKFTKPAVPPYNLIVQHKDYRSYTDQEGVQQRSFGNVYYHLDIRCLQQKQGGFNPANLHISKDVQEGAQILHKQFLLEQFGVHLN